MVFTTIKFAKIKNKINEDILKKFLKGLKTYNIRSKKPTRRGFLNPKKFKGCVVLGFIKILKILLKY